MILNICTLSYNISDNVSGVGSTSFADFVDINSYFSEVGIGSTTTIIGISSIYSGLKVFSFNCSDSESI
jgi:hypothetical protein